MALKIQLRDDYDAVRLRDLARCSSDPRQVRRLLSLAAVYDGLSREAAAAVGGMDRQTLRDWVHRFNKDGPEGLANRKGAGRRIAPYCMHTFFIVFRLRDFLVFDSV